MDEPEFKEIFDAMRNGAQKRVKQLFRKGSFMIHHERRKLVRTIGIILSMEKQIMVKITSPPRKSGITNRLNVQICKFDQNQLLIDEDTGKDKHLSGKLLPVC